MEEEVAVDCINTMEYHVIWRRKWREYRVAWRRKWQWIA
jgi:hypothetical protein